MREQFTNSCPMDVSVFLKDRSFKELEELAKLAKQYLNAHGKKLSTKAPVTKQDVKTSLPRTHKDAMRCYVCDGRGHKAVECPSKISTSRNEPFGHGLIALNVGQWDMKLMSAKQHYSALNLDPERGEGGRGSRRNPTQAQRVACAMQVPRRSDEKEAGLGMETLELKFGEMIEVLNGACMAETKITYLCCWARSEVRQWRCCEILDAVE